MTRENHQLLNGQILKRDNSNCTFEVQRVIKTESLWLASAIYIAPHLSKPMSIFISAALVIAAAIFTFKNLKLKEKNK